MRTAVRAAAATLILAIAGPALAQTPIALSLDEAVSRALERAPRVAEARAREAAAESTITSRNALSRPSATASAGYLRTNHVPPVGAVGPGGSAGFLFPDIPSNYRVRGELTVPILTSGRVEDFVDAARADTRAAGADRRTVEEDLRLEVARAYWMVVLARDAEQVLVQSLARSDAWVGDVKARVDAGVLPPNDLLSAQAQRARESVRLIQARKDSVVAEMDLARLIGEEPGMKIATTSVVDRSAPSMTEVARQSADALVARARELRPERAGLVERQSSLRFSAEGLLAALRPQVGALIAVEPSRPNKRFFPWVEEWKTGWDLGVNMTWLIFDSGKAKADRAGTMAQADAIGERLRDFDATLTVEVRRRVLDLEAGRAALVASDEAVAAATEARRVIGERFQAGVATSTDVLDADLAQLEAELERVRLHVGQRITEAALVRAVGGR
jgi:outer membrane protein